MQSRNSTRPAAGGAGGGAGAGAATSKAAHERDADAAIDAIATRYCSGPDKHDRLRGLLCGYLLRQPTAAMPTCASSSAAGIDGGANAIKGTETESDAHDGKTNARDQEAISTSSCTGDRRGDDADPDPGPHLDEDSAYLRAVLESSADLAAKILSPVTTCASTTHELVHSHPLDYSHPLALVHSHPLDHSHNESRNEQSHQQRQLCLGESEAAAVKRDARALCKDPRLREVALQAAGAAQATAVGAAAGVSAGMASVREIYHGYGGDGYSAGPAAAALAENIEGTLHLYAAKVLHGLGSRLLPASAWKEDQAGLWGRYRHVAFDDIVACLQDSPPHPPVRC